MLLSQALGLNRGQPALDFVDIDLETDTPLFLDPAAFYEGEGRFAEQCSRDLEEFFDAVLHAAGQRDWNLGLRLLRGLSEPDEIHLGFSSGRPAGRGIGEKQARQIFSAILASRAISTGLITDLNDTLMFIPGIGPDKVSDITTNVLRKRLIAYTQEQFELLGVPIEDEMPTGLLWDSVKADWTESYDYIPVIRGQKILLVPKRYVKYAYDFTKASQQYYDGYVASFIRQRELATMGKLVKFRVWSDEHKEPWVYKEDIEREVPRNKNSVADFSIQNPEVYDRFKDAFFKFDPMSVHAIVAAQGDFFDEQAYAERILVALDAVPTGARSASDYQSLIVGILHFVFYPSLTHPVLERAINQDRKRIDISFDNSAHRGLFERLRNDPFLLAREVMVECKNYTHDLSNPEIDQMIGRFDPRRGRFGIVVCRDVRDKDRLVERCTDAFRSQQGVVVVLTDADLKVALRGNPTGRETRLAEVIQDQLREQRS